MKIVWHKHNLWFLLRLVSVTLVSIHLRFPMNTYRGGRTSREKWFQLNVITNLVWDFFSSGVFHSHICCGLFRTDFFLEKLLLHTSSQWWWIVFVVSLTGERHLALFPAGTIVRDPHHRESPTCRKQGSNLRRTWVQAWLNEVAQ